MNRLARLITVKPWLTIGGVLAITVFFITQIVDLSRQPPVLLLQIDPSLDRLIPVHQESRLFYDDTRRVFGSDETILVAIWSDDLFTPQVLGRVKALSRRLSQLDGVDRVLSLFTALDIRGSEDELLIEPFISEVPEGADLIDRIRRRVSRNPVFAGNLVSADGKTTALLVHLEDMPEAEFITMGLDSQIETAAREEMGAGERVWLAGRPRLKVATTQLLISDLSVIIPLGLFLNGLVAFASFRRMRGVVVPLLCIGLANVWTIGTMPLLGYPLNLVSVLVPALVQTVGFAYTIHVVSEYDDHIRRHGVTSDPADLSPAGAALRQLLVPLGLTGLTTAAGLFSLTLSPLPAIRETGVISMFGVIYAMVIAATFGPAALAVGRQSPARAPRLNTAFDELAARLARFDVRHRKALLAVAAALFVISGIGAARIRVNTDFVSNFSPDHPIRRDWEAINEHLGGADDLSVVLRVDTRNAFKEPSNLGEVERLQEWIEAQPEIGTTTSLADYLRLIHWGFSNNDPEAMRLPESRQLVSQLLFFGGSEELERFVESTYQSTRILARSRTLDSAGSRALIERIDGRLEELPAHIQGRVTGNGVLLAESLDAIALGQARSLGLAFAFIFLVLVLLFRSLRVGLLALIPNALPVAFYFGLLGFTGVTLNATTSLVACIALGIAVDDTIHYLVRYRDLQRGRLSPEEAAVEALRVVGRPVTVTTIALCIGFMVLTAAELKNQAEFGLMTAITLAFAWLADIFITPAIAVLGSTTRGTGVRSRTLLKASVLALALTIFPWRAAAATAGVDEVRACVRSNAPRLSAVLRVTIDLENVDGGLSRTRAKVIWRRFHNAPPRFLVRMESPEDLAGAGLLVIPNPGGLPDAFVYLPALGRTRKVTSAKQARSVFSAELPLEEIRQMLDFSADAALRLLGNDSLDGRGVWRVEAEPNDEGESPYKRLVALIDQEYCIPLRIEFFEDGDRPSKRLRVPPNRVKRVANTWIPQEIGVEDLVRSTRSTITISDIEIDIQIAPALLTPKALSGPPRR